jgi:hypothetical protein
MAMSLLPSSTAVRLLWLSLLTRRLVPQARPLPKLHVDDSSFNVQKLLPAIARRATQLLSHNASA